MPPAFQARHRRVIAGGAGRVMSPITVVADSVTRIGDLKVRLAKHFDAKCVHLEELPSEPPGLFTLVDINLRDSSRVTRLKSWLARRPGDGRVIFSVDKKSHLESIQAYAIGATGLLPRPIDARMLAMLMPIGTHSDSGKAGEPAKNDRNITTAGVNGLRSIFSAAMLGEVPDVKLVNAAATDIVERIEEEGLSRWLDLIRQHHSQTYQHCLIVTAVAVAFGRHLGFSSADKQRLASAGLLHDVGKARIPIEILEKPTPLSEAEIAVMRTHPDLGFELLRDTSGLHPEMLDMVLHHHELLDGSGYPDGLSGNEISDLVRTMTIADVFGALIERRPYRPARAGRDAYQVLVDMGPKLDKDLVRVFQPLALTIA
jgi:putative nucleotidyltransferase with HDIG domain